LLAEWQSPRLFYPFPQSGLLSLDTLVAFHCLQPDGSPPCLERTYRHPVPSVPRADDL